jgi:Uncharacterised nucleotidyltransferase
VASEPPLLAEGRRLVQEAAARGLDVRLLGGIAIWARSSNGAQNALGREYPDIDLAARKQQSRQLRDLLEELGYEPERTFNATHGARRLLYHTPDRSYHLDVFLDELGMSHNLDLAERLDTEDLTLPAAELLLTKLQVAELNKKDAADAAMLLLEHEPADEDGPGKLNVARVAELCAADWGLYTTATDNLARVRELLPELLPDETARETVVTRIAELERRLEEEPKTRSWKLRAKIGRRKRWYEVPEEVTR